MARRRLNRRQTERIRRRQRERANRAIADTAAQEGGPEQPGLVVAQFGQQVEVEDDAGASHRCHLRANLEELVTGDRVIWRAGEGGAVVVARLARRNALLRPDPYGEPRAIAANIDRMVLVIAPQPEPHPTLIDRYLVAAENMGIETLILLNKADLLEQDPGRAAALDALLQIYTELGYPLLRTSATGTDPGDLQAALSGRVSVLVGQSGVGKSSLVNALLPKAQQRIGALSEAAPKGTHTTTTARYFHLAGGGGLVDSPGIREFGLWHMSRKEIEGGFRELVELAAQCRYRDCRHSGEPGCAVADALAGGRLHPSRMASYQHITRSQGAS